jgi:hypothetical protein
VEKKRVESSPLRREIGNGAQHISKITTTNTSTKTSPDINAETGRLKRSDVLISAGSDNDNDDNYVYLNRLQREDVGKSIPYMHL